MDLIIKQAMVHAKEDAINVFGYDNVGTAEHRALLSPLDQQFLTQWLLSRGLFWLEKLLPRISAVCEIKDNIKTHLVEVLTN